MPKDFIGLFVHLIFSTLSLLCFSFPIHNPSVLFLILSVEIMALRIRNNKDIKGFQIKIDEQTHSIKISQLADDTTLYFNSKSHCSLHKFEYYCIKF
jgi:hypothetical protein